MGKGDKKTRKGKISMGSYGVLRPKAKNKPAVTKSDRKPVEKAAPKKAVTAKTEVAKPAAKAAAKKPAAKKAPAKKKDE
jgi:30S ribosomal protein S31